MTQINVITQFWCPNCTKALAPSQDGPASCPQCAWKGEAYLFSPRMIEVMSSEAALPEDAICIHHPRKKATAVCAGTGDYICSLCTIETNGQTYSAQYLDGAGKETASKAFDRTLPRPDSLIVLYVALIFAPYVDFLIIPFAFLWIPHGFYLYSKALRQRRESELFRRVMGPARMITLPILLSLSAIAWVCGLVALLVGTKVIKL